MREGPGYRPFLYLVLILAGSAVTLLLLTGMAGSLWAASGGNRWGGALALFLVVIGWGTGGWILTGRAWRPYPRSLRGDLAFGYLAVGWIGGIALFWDSPGVAYWLPGGLLILLIHFSSRLFYHVAEDEDLFP